MILEEDGEPGANRGRSVSTAEGGSTGIPRVTVAIGIGGNVESETIGGPIPTGTSSLRRRAVPALEISRGTGCAINVADTTFPCVPGVAAMSSEAAGRGCRCKGICEASFKAPSGVV